MVSVNQLAIVTGPQGSAPASVAHRSVARSLEAAADVCVVGGGMAVLGIPYALFLGFLSGITDFIPFLGVLIAALPAILLGLSDGGLWGVLKVVIVLLVAVEGLSPAEAAGVLPARAGCRAEWDRVIGMVFAEAGLEPPAVAHMQTGGRQGIHGEALGHMLAEMQSLARAHPGAVW